MVGRQSNHREECFLSDLPSQMRGGGVPGDNADQIRIGHHSARAVEALPQAAPTKGDWVALSRILDHQAALQALDQALETRCPNQAWCATRIEGLNMRVPITSAGWKKLVRSIA